MKELNFKKINNKPVGYELTLVKERSSDAPSPQYALTTIKFKDFITPYIRKAENYMQVQDNLRENLEANIQRQNSVTDGKRSVMIDILATATLQREAIRNSMKLISDHYIAPVLY